MNEHWKYCDVWTVEWSGQKYIHVNKVLFLVKIP
jgi:hypothetical protein